MRGRDLLLKIGDGADPEVFKTIGSARMISMAIDNQPIDNTSMNSNGFQSFQSDAGLQTMEIVLEGVFKDTSTEELLRLAVFNRTVDTYQFFFPNADKYEASFIVNDYQRGRQHEGLESFSVTLLRTGNGSFTAGV